LKDLYKELSVLKIAKNKVETLDEVKALSGLA